MRKYGESKTTRTMMATVPQITSGSGLRKFQADGFLFDRVYNYSTKMFTRRAKSIRIIGDPDNQHPVKRSSIVLRNKVRCAG